MKNAIWPASDIVAFFKTWCFWSTRNLLVHAVNTESAMKSVLSFSFKTFLELMMHAVC